MTRAYPISASRQCRRYLMANKLDRHADLLVSSRLAHYAETMALAMVLPAVFNTHTSLQGASSICAAHAGIQDGGAHKSWNVPICQWRVSRKIARKLEALRVE